MPVGHLGASDAGWAIRLLVDAFRGHLPVSVLFREPGAARKLQYFMKCTWNYACLFGECHGADNRGGVALWLTPGATRMTPGRMFRAGMFKAPYHMGLRDFRSFAKFAEHTDKAHRSALSEPHYYLLALAVHPQHQGTGIGKELTEGMLERARSEAVPVYLETQTRENVAYYSKLGFEVVSDTPIETLGLRNWGMVKR